MSDTEKRKNTRVKFHTTVTAFFSDKVYEECELKDLSTGGVFVYGITGPKKGDTCDLALRLVGATEDFAVQVKGQVVRVAPEGVGIIFLETDIDSLAHLQNIVYYNTPNPDQLDESDLSWIPPKNR